MSLPRQLQQYLDGLRAAGVEYVRKAGPAPARAQRAAPVAAVDPDAGRRVSLKLLAEEIEDCARCLELFSTRSHTVFGEGPLDAPVGFLGDGPDSTDDREGRPFLGESSAWLNSALAAIGMEREAVYLLNVTRCRAPKRFPKAKECENCRGYLVRELELAKPNAICCLGTLVAQTLLNSTEAVDQLRGVVHDYAGIPVVCTFHPAYLVKSPKSIPEAEKDWELLRSLMN